MRKNQNTPSSPFELALADLRGQLRGVNLYWLADKARLSRATVENLVSGKTKSPHARTIFDIEVALGLLRMSPARTKSKPRAVSAQNKLAVLAVPAKAQPIAVRKSRSKWTHVRTTTRAFAALQRRRMR